MSTDLLLHAAAGPLGAGQTRGLSPIRNDGSPVPPNSGVNGEAGGLAEFFGTVNPNAPWPLPPRVFSEVDPAAAAAYVKAVNDLLGFGFAEPVDPDLSQPAAPGTPHQRAYKLIARCNGNLDEFGHLLESGAAADPDTFHKGQWGGVLDPYLPDGYKYTEKEQFCMPYMKALADLLGRSGGVITAATAQAALPRVDYRRALANGTAALGETLATWTARCSQVTPANPTGAYISPWYDNMGEPRPTALPVPPPIAAPAQAATPAPAAQKPNQPTAAELAAVEASADHHAVVSGTGPSAIGIQAQVAAAPADVHAAASAAWQIDWPIMRPTLIAAGHGTLVVSPPLRQSILAAIYPRYVALAQAGLIGADGKLRT